MQTKPGSENVFYIEFNGGKITSPVPSQFTYYGQGFSWVDVANFVDTNGTYIDLVRDLVLGKYINEINVPASISMQSQKTFITQWVGKFYEIFDVNVTDEINIFNGANKKKRWRCIVTRRPSAENYNNLLNNFQENTSYPYSWRRFLVGTAFNTYGLLIASALGIQLSEINMNWHLNGGFTEGGGNLLGNRALPWSDPAMNYPCFVFENSTSRRYVLQTANFFQTPQMIPYGQSADIVKYNTTVAQAVAHELGHNCGILEHESYFNEEYYMGHTPWGPLMGFPYKSRATQGLETLIQWSKGEYRGARDNVDDILKLQEYIPFIKKPKKSKNTANANDVKTFELVHNSDVPKWDQNLGYNVRTLTKSDVVTDDDGRKSIKGMIGFQYDFDVFKILLPEGTYNFSIDPLAYGLGNANSSSPSMFDPDILLLNCHCQRSKEEANPSCNQNDLPSFYPDNIAQNKMQCVAFNPDIGGNYTPIQQFSPDNGFSMKIATASLSKRSIVYLMIRGDKNLTPSDGWSRYGSVGKYNLRITRNSKNGFSDDPSTFLSNNILPKARCEEYNVCNNNTFNQVLLYVQDEIGSSGNQNEEHFLEIDTIKNGEIEKKKFLVYGQPIDSKTNTDTPEYSDRFFLTIPINGECKKQEFVVGNDWEKKKEE